MAKRPIESHRFKIHCEAGEEKLGRILAQLTLLGVENVGYELITDVKVFGTRPPRDPDQSKAEDFAAAWIKTHPTFEVGDLGRYFKDNGRAQSTAHYVVRTMTAKGLLRSLGEAIYQSTEIKHIEGPKAKPAAKATKAPPKLFLKKTRTRLPNPTPRFEITNRELVEKSIRSKHRFTLKQLQQVFSDAKRNPHSVSPIVWHLVKDRIVKQVEPGTYEVLPRKAPTAKNHTSFLEQERIRSKNYRDSKKKQQQEAPAPVSIETSTTTEEAANG